MWFDGWSALGRVLVAGSVSYAALVIVLRTSGKRTLGKMNAFDLVVTVALGSTFATILLTRSVPLAEGVTALALLAFLQFSVAWLAVRSHLARSLAKSAPSLLLRDGVILDDVLRRQRVTRGEVRQALRSQGVGAVEDVTAVVLETDGTFSVIPRSSAGSRSALLDVRDTSDGSTGAAGPAGPREDLDSQGAGS